MDDPDARYYQPPPGTTAANGGRITGSRITEQFPVSDQTAFVRAVAGERVRDSKDAYATPVLLPAGNVNVTIAWSQGSLFGQVTVPLAVKPNDSLLIRQQRVDKEQARVWLEDAATHATVGSPMLVRLEPVQILFEH
jgi:hypothetical protein